MARIDWILVFCLLFLIALPIYVFWPFDLIVKVISKDGVPIVSNISIYHFVGPFAASTIGSQQIFRLWKGHYLVNVVAQGFTSQSFEISNPIGWIYDRSVSIDAVLEPSSFKLSGIDFRDPTGSMKIFPWIEVDGSSISGGKIKANLSITDSLEYGDYLVRVADSHFNLSFVVNGSLENRPIFLRPNSGFEVYSIEEAKDSINFLYDYSRYFGSLPSHFYLYESKRHLYTGDLLALACQDRAIKMSKSDPDSFFLPRSHKFSIGGRADCYGTSINGDLPTDLLYRINISAGNDFWPILDERVVPFPLALTFDLESGRYIDRKGWKGISPCENSTTILGVPQELQRSCDASDIIPWFSPLEGPHVGVLPYPWATGREGMSDVTDISNGYGVPFTLFIVPRELVVMDSLDPSLKTSLAPLVDRGYLEIGSTLWMGSVLGRRSERVEDEDIKRSKAFLESSFNASVVGFRSPFFGVIRNNPITQDDVLSSMGFVYWSGLPTQRGRRNIPVEIKLGALPISVINGSISGRSTPLVVQGFPWDFTHKELVVKGDTILRRDPQLHNVTRSKILFMIGQGGSPVLMRDLAKRW